MAQDLIGWWTKLSSSLPESRQGLDLGKMVQLVQYTNPLHHPEVEFRGAPFSTSFVVLNHKTPLSQ